MTQQFYFKINLNKFGEMKLQQEREQKTFITAIIAFCAGTILLFAGVVYLNIQVEKKLTNRKNFLTETENQIKSYQTSSDYISGNDLDNLAKTFNNRIFWAKKMVALSQEINAQLVVSSFSYKSGVLTFKGVTPIDKNVRETDLVDNFRTRLLSNTEISSDFPEIKIGGYTRTVAKDTDLLEFTIECFSKEVNSRKGGLK